MPSVSNARGDVLFMKCNPLKRIGALALVVITLASMSVSAAAADKPYSPSGENYEFSKDAGFDLPADQKPVGRFSYGKTAMGKVTLAGAINRETTLNGWTAYGVNGPVTFGYSYDGSYQEENPDRWHIFENCTEKSILGIPVSKKVKTGAVIIQKSEDGVTWENATKPVADFFHDNPTGSENLYVTPESEIMNGMYYRVIIGYEMTRRTAENEKFLGLAPDEYVQKECVEVYRFYISSDKNYVSFNDVVTYGVLNSGSTTSSGFRIQMNGSTDQVMVKRDNLTATKAVDYEQFSKPGKYTIEVTTSLGKKHSFMISVSDGMALTTIQPKVYESEKNSGFPTENLVGGYTVLGRRSLTTVTLGRTAGTSLSTSTHNDYPAYGMSGQQVSLFLKLNEIPSGDWTLENDKWGKKEKEKINNVATGEIGKGALVIQTSKDGKTWSDVEMGRYANGLYTTDYATHYAGNENVLIYTPAGIDVLNGIYIRVLFAYQLNNKGAKDTRDYVEEYAFYLCSNELDAVTFHNLSVANQVSEMLGEADETTVELYQAAETMLSGAGTTTGFQIDTRLNPTVSFEVKRNGTRVGQSGTTIFMETGKYDITLTSAVGTTKNVTLYVDRQTNEEALAMYFGENFLTGKRIFAEGEYPVYEAEQVRYHVPAITKEFLPVYGTILNETTGSVIEIERSRTAKDGALMEAGDYVAQFTTNPAYSEDETSGDARVFTFRFRVIPAGTAPGPVVNQKSLNEYAHSTMVDSKPVYYGLTYQSAAKGNITLAFASKKDAVDYAYNYEKGQVEVQPDGSYRYSGIFNVEGPKSKYESNWDLVDAMYYFAEQAVHELYFDMSDQFTYRTLAPKDLVANKNLRTLELQSSVVIFADGQKELLTDIQSLPILNDKPYAYLNVRTGSVSEGFSDFEFVTDRYGGLDSNQVTITDGNGKAYEIQYSKSVGKQLEEAGCPSGVVTITETTKFGDTAQYKALYIAPGDNQSELKVTCYSGKKAEEKVITKANAGQTIKTDSFQIADLTDALDPYALVIVKNGQREFMYQAGKTSDEIWSDPGKYTITCVNRLGYGYTVNVTVMESDNAVITFSGDETEGLQSILTMYNASNVKLPTLSQKGYNFVGFTDSESGKIYNGEIAKIDFRGEKTLISAWTPKTVTVYFMDVNGNLIKEMPDAEFGRFYELETLFPDTYIDWRSDVAEINGKTLHIDSEDPIAVTLIAGEVEGTDEQSAQTEEKKSKGSGAAVALVAIAGAVAGGGGYWYHKKKEEM